MTWRPLTILLAVLSLLACAAPAPSGPASSPPAPFRAAVAEGGMCAGFAGFQCAQGLSCQMIPGQCHVIADAAGTCRKPPQMCSRIYAPICGCDGKTYASACVAATAGVSVASEGACKV